VVWGRKALKTNNPRKYEGKIAIRSKKEKEAKKFTATRKRPLLVMKDDSGRKKVISVPCMGRKEQRGGTWMFTIGGASRRTPIAVRKSLGGEDEGAELRTGFCGHFDYQLSIRGPWWMQKKAPDF